MGAETGAGRMTPEMLQPIFPTGSSWSYTTETPGKDWTTRFPVTPNSAEECPKLSPAPFGVTPTHSEHSTPWTSNDIWLTAEVNLPENYVPKPLFLHFFHDEDLEVFINGESVLERKGFITRYAMAQMRRNPLRAGSNLLAVHCRQTEGSQGVDVGLYDSMTRKNSKCPQIRNIHSASWGAGERSACETHLVRIVLESYKLAESSSNTCTKIKHCELDRHSGRAADAFAVHCGFGKKRFVLHV